MKKIIGKIGFALEIVIIVLLFVVSIFSLMGRKNDGVASDPIFGISMLPVQSDSMNGDKPDSFEKGDLVISKSIEKYEKKNELKVGDIITYKSNGGEVDLITHRIVDIKIEYANNKKIIMVYAQGDNHEMSKVSEYVPYENIKCVYIKHVKNVGGFIDFFKDKTNYALFIVLPLVLLFAWNIYSFAKALVDYKRGKQLETAMNGGEVSDELKEIAIREYLAKQAAEAKAAEEKDAKQEPNKEEK